MISFEQASYLAQVKRLRSMAHVVLKYYPIKVKKIELKRYAANTVYKVTDTRNKYYQLRIHPKSWHTKAAIVEEIKWLNHILQTTNLRVPRPILNADEQYITLCQHPSVPTSRYCELFEWLPGKKRWGSINKQNAQDIGALAGKLHINGQEVRIKHRFYWDTDSLVGTTTARYFNVEMLSGIKKISKPLLLVSGRRFITISKPMRE